VKIWKCGNVKMWKCGNVKVRKWEGLKCEQVTYENEELNPEGMVLI
jgi:hypothetical protein